MKTTVKKPGKKTDARTHRIYDALKAAFPSLSTVESDVVYRRDPYSIRVRVIDESFADKSLPARHSAVKKALAAVDPADRDEISMMLMLSPEEFAEPDPVSLEFDNPGRNR